MSREIIDVGSAANDGAGDPLRTAMIKTNNNFAEIYSAGPVTSNVKIANNTVTIATANSNLILQANGTGSINTNHSILPNGNLTLDIGSTSLRYGNLYAGNLNASGTLDVTGNIIGGNIDTPGTLSAGILNITSSVNIADTTISSLTVTGNSALNNLNITGATTATTISATGNISADNISATVFVEAAAVDATGNIEGGNLITSGQVIATGNVTGGNLVTSGTVSATDGNIGNSLYFQSSGTYQSAAYPGTASALQLLGNITGNIITGRAGLVLESGGLTLGNATTATQNTIYGNVTITENLDVDGEINGNITFDDITANSFTGPLTGNVTGNVTGTSDQASNVYIRESTDDDNEYNVIFKGTTGGGNDFTDLQVDNGGITFNPSDNKLSLATGSTLVTNFIQVTGNTGNIKFNRDNSVQTTAYPGTSSTLTLFGDIRSTLGNIRGARLEGKLNLDQGFVPEAASGVDGDLIGDFKFDSNKVYVAIDDYDGSTDIWKTLPLASYDEEFPSLTATGNVTGGNLTTAGQVVATGNVTGANFIGSVPGYVESDTTGITGADQVTNMVSLTQAEYDAITPDASTVYIIVG